jgi:hypothetical protein
MWWVLLVQGMFAILIESIGGLLVKSLHVVLIVADLRAESCPAFQHHHYIS